MKERRISAGVIFWSIMTNVRLGLSFRAKHSAINLAAVSWGNPKEEYQNALSMLILYLARCLKITEKVSFNIASEASYIYILTGQKLIKNAKKRPILASFWKPKAYSQTVLPDSSVLLGQKLVENAKIQMRHFE